MDTINQLFTAAIGDVPKMSQADRYKLAGTLPAILDKHPAFGQVLCERLIGDGDEGVAKAALDACENIFKTDPDRGVAILESAWPHVRYSSDFYPPIYKILDMLPLVVKHDFDAAIKMLDGMVRSSGYTYSKAIEHLTSRIVDIAVAKGRTADEKKQIFGVAQTCMDVGFEAERNNRSDESCADGAAIAILKIAPKLAKADKAAAFELIETIFSIDMHTGTRGRCFEEMNNIMPALAAIDPVRTFDYLEAMFDYTFPNPKRAPAKSIPGVLVIAHSSEGNPYEWLRSYMLMAFEKIAPTHPDRAFAFADKVMADSSPWQTTMIKYHLATLVPLNPQRVMRMVETRFGVDQNQDDYIDVLAALSRFVRSKKLYGMVDAIIETGKPHNLNALSQGLANFKGVPVDVKARWAKAVYQSPHIPARSHEADVIRKNISLVSTVPADEASARMKAVLAEFKIAF